MLSSIILLTLVILLEYVVLNLGYSFFSPYKGAQVFLSYLLGIGGEKLNYPKEGEWLWYASLILLFLIGNELIWKYLGSVKKIIALVVASFLLGVSLLFVLTIWIYYSEGGPSSDLGGWAGSGLTIFFTDALDMMGFVSTVHLLAGIALSLFKKRSVFQGRSSTFLS